MLKGTLYARPIAATLSGRTAGGHCCVRERERTFPRFFNQRGIHSVCVRQREGVPWVSFQQKKEFVRGNAFFSSESVNPKVNAWIKEIADLCLPDDIHVCDGTERENEHLINEMVSRGSLVHLDPQLRPDSYLARSDPRDVARVEKQTYICSESEEEAGPTNNWMAPEEMRAILKRKLNGSMLGRKMYVVPFSMGPIGSPLSKIGYQITDSAYVVANMRIMTRMGEEAELALQNGDFVPCVHSVGAPLRISAGGPIEVEDSLWPCNDEKYIVHFPETREIFSYGSGYGGNSLLGKKCFALRIASVLGREEGWLAEHMLILSITNPEGKKKYFAAAFPSACGKTNLALLTPTLPGWKVECVGDDIAWMRFGSDGRLYAINPENGFFGVAPGTSESTNPNAMRTIQRGTLFTNVALNPETNDVWWEGIGPPPPHLIDWKGQPWTPADGRVAAHPNSRFTTPLSNCPIRDADTDAKQGVPISAIIFGGRRSSTVPLVYQALSWQHGTFMGASVASEQTAAAEGVVGSLRHDPFAMLPFCGYNMADYFAHWLSVPSLSKDPSLLPKIFSVNWFRKGSDGMFLWPGFGENSRVLEWIFNRTDEEDSTSSLAIETPIGFVPKSSSINTDGLSLSHEDIDTLLRVERDGWRTDLKSMEGFLQQFGDRVPPGIRAELNRIQSQL